MEIPTTFLVAIFAAIIAASIAVAFLMVPTAWQKIAGHEAELAAMKPVAVAVPYWDMWYLAVFASTPAEITRVHTASGDVITGYNGSIQLQCNLTSVGSRCLAVLVLPERPSAVELRFGLTTVVVPVAGYARYNPFAFRPPILFNINFTGEPGVYVLAAPSNISTSSSWQLYLLGLPVYASNSGPWPLTTSGGPGRYAVWGMSDWPGLRYLVACNTAEEVLDACGPVFGQSQRLSKPGTYIILFAESPVNVTMPPWSNYGATPARPPFYCVFTLYRNREAFANCIYNTGLSLNDICWTEPTVGDPWGGVITDTYCKKPIKLFIYIDVKPYNNTHLIARASLIGMLVDRHDNFALWVHNGNLHFYPPLLLVRQIVYLPWPKLYGITVTVSKSYVVDTSDRGVLNDCLTC